MRRVSVALCVVALAMSGPAPVLAADWTGFYAGFYGGGAVRNDADAEAAIVFGQFTEGTGPDSPAGFHNYNDSVDPLTFKILSDAVELFNTVGGGMAEGALVEGAIGYNPGIWLGGVTGYSFGNGVRVEGDWSHGSFAASQFQMTDGFLSLYEGDYITPDDYYSWGQFGSTGGPGDESLPLNGSVTLRSSADFYLANVWYDFDNASSFAPYVGGGAGVAYIRHTVNFGGGDSESLGQFALAGQLGVGVRVDLNETSFLDFGYRYKLAGDTSARFTHVQSFGDGAFIGYGADIHGMTEVQTLQLGYNLIIK